MINFELDTKKITDNIIKLEKNILIYPHLSFSTNDGGIMVQYYLAYVLSKLGINVQIYNIHDNNSLNPVYNNFINNINDINFDDTIVIYCEGVVGNPLKAKYIVRWMLSKLGQNVPYHHYDSWNPNELVYFFNSEKEMVNKNIQFKLLSLFYLNPEIKNNNLQRKGLCYTIRKKTQFSNTIDINTENNKINSLLNLPIFEITRHHNQNDYIEIFNTHEYFISYDPLTFLNIIAILCGCISIVYPIDGVSKIEYFKMTPFYEYMVEKNTFEIYGLAYGIHDEEINYSKNTLHLAPSQMIDIQNWFIDKYIKQFLHDISHWHKNYNILIYYKYSMCENIPVFDVDFYRSIHDDLKDFPNDRLINHFYHYGIPEKRLASEKQFYILYPDFDPDFYKYLNYDLKNYSNNLLLRHYYYFGNDEKRITSVKHFYEIYPYFDANFYKTIHNDLRNLSNIDAILHYYNYGKNEERLTSEKNIEYYRSFHKNFKNITSEEINAYYSKSKIITKNIQCSNLLELKLLNHIKLIENTATNKIKKNIVNPDSKITNPNYNNLYLSWFNDSINNRKISIISPMSGKIIYSDKYFITNNIGNENTKYSICNYYFDEEEILLGLGLGTGNHPQEAHILYVYSIKKNNIFYEWWNYSFEEFKNKLFLKILMIFNNVVKNYNFELVNNKITTIYGYMHNMGHMLFNDYSGLYLLDSINISAKIDEIIFGNHDVYYIKEYFQQFKNINIVNNNDIENIETIGKGVCFKYNNNFILDDTITFLKNNLETIFRNNIDISLNYENEKNNAELIRQTHYPIFNIVLRKGDYEMNNQVITISNLINLLIQKYPNAFFYLDGFVKNPDNSNILIGINHNIDIIKITNDYLELSNEIIKNINTQNVKSLINTNILHLVTNIQNCNYGIYTLGSAACNSVWICKIPGIQFGRSCIKIYEIMDKLIRENMPNINYFNYGISYDQNGNFNIQAETIYNAIPIF